MIGHNNWSEGYKMTADNAAIAPAGQKVYTIKTIQWDGATQCAVFGTDGVWGGEGNNIAHRKNYAPASTSVINLSENLVGNREYIIKNGTIKEVLTVFSFDANGGTGTMMSVGHKTLEYTLPECTFTAPEGKVFAGWSTSANGAVITASSIKTLEDTTLYAVWENAPSYTVTVAKNLTGGSVSVDNTTAAAGETVIITATPADGYDLESIVYEPDGQSKVYINSADNRYSLEMPAANVTVSAIFKTHVHSWTYTGDGTDKLTASCTCGKSESLQIHAPDWQNGNYEATLSDGNSGTAPVSVGEATVGQIVYAGTDGTDYAESTTAPPSVGKYTASVAVGDKGQAKVEYEIVKADPVITPPTASAITAGQTLADSTLAGGSATGAGGQAVPGTFTWEDPSIVPTVADSNTTEYTVVFTPDDTANYNTVTCKVMVIVDPVMYTVTLDYNYDSEVPYTEDVPEGSGLSYMAESYEQYRSNYRFDGWFASNDNGATFTGEAVDLDTLIVTSDITLYAKWTRVYSVYVEGIQATEHNHSDMLGDGTVSYDPDTNTLTLNNASLEGALDEESGNIYPAITAVTPDKALTLVLKGSNTATALSHPSYQATAVEVHGDLKITGSGSLTASAKSAANTQQEGSYGIRVLGGGLTMNGTGVVTGIAEAETRNTYCYGVSTSYDITVNSGTLRGLANKDTSSTDVSYGVYTERNLKANGGEIIAYAGATGRGHMSGIFVAGELSVGADAHLESYGTENAIKAGSITVEEAKRVLEVKDEKEDESEYRKTVEDDEWADFDYVKTVPIFTVTFVADGVPMDEQTGPSGADATMPEVPAKEGYTGTWDSDGKNITKDTTITAQYEKISSGESGGVGGDSDNDSDNPDTGDGADLMLCSVMGLTSLLCMAMLFVLPYRKKGKCQNR